MSSFNQEFHDKIAKLCLECFKKLPKTGKPKENEWTVLSCIVLEQFENFEVVALGTGTKCIGASTMSAEGDILNDSHAEVICRRVFLRYLYENMLQDGTSLLTYNPKKEIFSIKNCKFHFFTTHVPCGDAAIFAKQDCEYFGTLITDVNKKRVGDTIIQHVDKKLKLNNNNSGDIFRTGAKCLKEDYKQDPRQEGTNFHITGVVRTKPGRGDPTLSVSCSDKLAKWSHLGVQGALMSLLVNEPIYFSTITIVGDSPFDQEAFYRALFGRLRNVELHHPYHSLETVFGQSVLKFNFCKEEEKNPCSSSIIWLNTLNAAISKQLEVAVGGIRQGVTKKKMKSAGALQICKRELFKKFTSVIKKYGITRDNLSTFNTYKETKLAAKDYQAAWSTLKNSFKIWTVKDEHLLDFRI